MISKSTRKKRPSVAPVKIAKDDYGTDYSTTPPGSADETAENGVPALVSFSIKSGKKVKIENAAARLKVLQSMGAKTDADMSYKFQQTKVMATRSVIQAQTDAMNKMRARSTLQQLFRAKSKAGTQSKPHIGLTTHAGIFSTERFETDSQLDSDYQWNEKDNGESDDDRSRSVRKSLDIDPKVIQQRKKEYLIPKDRAAWLEYLAQLAKKKIHIEYLSDK